MQEPARRLAGRIEAQAEDPEAAPLGGLDPVVAEHPARTGPAVAGGLAPPLLSQTLGPLGAADPVVAAAPPELDRRIVGDRGHGLDRFGAAEQAYRPRPIRRPGFCGGGGQGRSLLHGALGQPALDRRGTPDPILAQPVYQLVDQGFGPLAQPVRVATVREGDLT